MAGTAYIGTSGFVYNHWRDIFYPPEVPQKRWLEYYAEHFDTVELNNTFYSMPRANVCRSWFDRSPEKFIFVVKLNRIITHRKRLHDVQSLMDSFMAAAGELQHKLGPILVQLPPKWQCNAGRLDEFLGRCGPGRWAVEFRDQSWLCQDIFDTLERHEAALVIHDNLPNHPYVATADWVYLRYHGSMGHNGNYDMKFLRGEAAVIGQYLAEGRDVYVYFNNDVGGHAVHNALDLRRLVAEQTAAARR